MAVIAVVHWALHTDQHKLWITTNTEDPHLDLEVVMDPALDILPTQSTGTLTIITTTNSEEVGITCPRR